MLGARAGGKTGTMEWWFVIFLVLFVFAVAWMLFGRHHNTTGGVTERSMKGRETSGGEGASDGSDREAFHQEAGQHGTK